MVQVPDEQREGVHHEEVAGPEADEREGHVLEGPVHDGLERVVAKVRGEAHLAHRVMHFVQAPERGHRVQEPVNAVVHQVAQHEEQGELRSVGQAAHVEERALEPQASAYVHDERARHVAQRDVAEQAEAEEVKRHVKGVEAEVLAQERLLPAPGPEPLEGEGEEAHRDQQRGVATPARRAQVLRDPARVAGEALPGGLPYVDGHDGSLDRV